MDVDLEAWEPALWGLLPKELLLLVFSRLSASGISQLRLLSKDWKRDIETAGSEFSRLLDETVNPSMFGLIAWTDCGEFCGRVFDMKSCRWHHFRIQLYDYVITMGAADGGLIFFVSERAKKPLCIIVMNPLTRKQVQLPRLLGMECVRPTPQPTMVQLVMDSEKQHYKVFVAGHMKRGGRDFFAQVYDSTTKGWTVVGSEQQSWDRIHGCEYRWSKDDDIRVEIALVNECMTLGKDDYKILVVAALSKNHL